MALFLRGRAMGRDAVLPNVELDALGRDAKAVVARPASD
jgi:hypothetical protein